jgi:hypothetical protein
MKQLPNRSAHFALLLALGECHRRLKQHASAIKDSYNIRQVTHVTDMPNVSDSFRLEEYVDAELNCGDAISWCLEITVAEKEIVVEADVRRIHGSGQDVIAKIGDFRFCQDADNSSQLLEITERLCCANPE